MQYLCICAYANTQESIIDSITYLFQFSLLDVIERCSTFLFLCCCHSSVLFYVRWEGFIFLPSTPFLLSFAQFLLSNDLPRIYRIHSSFNPPQPHGLNLSRVFLYPSYAHIVEINLTCFILCSYKFNTNRSTNIFAPEIQCCFICTLTPTHTHTTHLMRTVEKSTEPGAFSFRNCQ